MVGGVGEGAADTDDASTGTRQLTENDDGGGAVPDLLVLGAAQLDHALGGRVGHVNLR